MQTQANDITVITPYNMSEYDRVIETFYAQSPPDFLSKLEAAACFFLNKPYLFEPLGEGSSGFYSQEPLYRTDLFDCVTFVDTVLALARSHDLSQFQQNILSIRYLNQEVNFIKRTDWFTDLEWNTNAQSLGWIQNITDQMDTRVASAHTMIDKPRWYSVKHLNHLRLLKPLPMADAKQRLLELRNEGQAFCEQPSTITYIPLTELFDHHNQPNTVLFNRIPSGSIIEIVRPNWPIKDVFNEYPQGYGTNLNVSHLGIALRTNDELMFHHATSIQKKVVELPLSDYLREFIHHETIKGIHVEQIVIPLA